MSLFNIICFFFLIQNFSPIIVEINGKMDPFYSRSLWSHLLNTHDVFNSHLLSFEEIFNGVKCNNLQETGIEELKGHYLPTFFNSNFYSLSENLVVHDLNFIFLILHSKGKTLLCIVM